MKGSLYLHSVCDRTLRAMKFAALSAAVFFCFLASAYSMDVTLQWDPDPTANGYKIYYRTGRSGPPYSGTGAAEGDSPIDVGYTTEFTLRALADDEVHFFVATAYNDDLESDYSNEVSTSLISGMGEGESVGVSVASDGGSDGEGCFISALMSKQKSRNF